MTVHVASHGAQHGLRPLWRSEDGAAAVEFALLLPILALIVAGLIDTSRLITHTLQVRAAAQAGAEYGLKRDGDAAGVAGAAAAATPLAVSANSDVVTGCVTGASVVPEPGPACPAGGQPGRFMTVAASAAFEPLLPGPHGMVMPPTVSARAMVRLP